MYHSLLLPEGGITTNTQKTKQTKDPVLVIGIGGTGAKALDVLKGKIKKQLEVKPEDDHIRFLEIDADVDWVRNCKNIDDEEEFINLQDPKIKDKFNNKVTLKDLISKPQFQWLQAGEDGAESIKIPDGLNGGGGIRQLGRYMIINEASLIYNRLKSEITTAINGIGSADLNIHILTGISGGMGSGCFLDTCYILRKVLSDMAIGAATVFGYVFLPDVITTIPAIASDPNKIAGNYRNGYAGLMELDYLMNLQNNYGTFSQNYGSFSITTQQTPVDMCHLISALDHQGNHKARAFDYSMNVAADYIMSYLSETDTNSITPKGHLVNINQGMDLLNIDKGAFHRYHILGASSAELPLTEVATYLATGLFKQMHPYLIQKPVDQDVEEFASKKLNLSIEKIKKMVTEKVKLAVDVPQPVAELVKNVTAPYVHSEAIIQPVQQWLSAQTGIIEKNALVLNEASAYTYDENTTSFIGKIFNELYELATSAQAGPRFAISMFQRNGRSIIDIITDLHLEADRLARKLEKDIDQQAEQAEEAKQMFLKSKNSLFNRHAQANAYEIYRESIAKWYRRKLDFVIYSQIDRILLGLRQKINELYQGYFAKLDEIIENLIQTFDANQDYFASEQADGNSLDGFTQLIMKFSDIKPHLDLILYDEKPDDAAVKLMRTFLDNSNEWISEDETRINKLVNHFIHERFKSEMNKNMQDYLRQKYAGYSPAERDKALLSDIFLPLKEASEPLFWCGTSASVYNTYSNTTMSVPADSPYLAQAANKFQELEANVQVRLCHIGDRIFMMRLFSGMPLYGYHGLTLMKKTYDELGKVGVHLYGRGEEVWADMLPTPIPYSLDPSQSRNGAEIEAAFKRAKKLGFIVESRDNWELFSVDMDKYADQLQFLTALCCFGKTKISSDEEYASSLQAKQVHDKYFEYDAADMNQKIHELMMLKSEILSKNGLKYAIESYQGIEEITLDNIIHSPALSKALLDIVYFYDAIEMAISRIEFMINRGGEEQQSLDDFCNAFFTGVLKQGIGKISYKYEAFHQENEVVLSSNNMPYSRFTLFQAYLTYYSLDASIRDRIISDTTEKLEHLEPGDDEIALKIKEKYSSAYMKRLAMMYRKDARKDEIETFYESFYELLYSFIEQFE